MDRQERAPQPVDVLAAVLQAHQSQMWTAMPGVVQRYDAAKGIVDVQVAIQMQLRQPGPDGNTVWLDIPMLLDCPVYFPSGGGFTLTFPIIQGDECLVVFANRCVDAWWESGGTSNQQAEFRMHDLSDGFAFVGVRSKGRASGLAASTADVVLRSDDGTAKIAIKADKKIEITTPVEVLITTATVKIVGNLDVSGTIEAGGIIHSDVDVIADDVSGHNHVHVKGGGASTDPPTPM